MKNWLFLSIAIIAEVIATSSLKSSEGFTKVLPSMMVVIGYGVAFYFLSLTLKTIPVGVAYAIWSGSGIVLISLIGWWAFGQKLDIASAFGMGLIVAGVVVINVFSNATAH
jgi:small multidrug resistance pump